MIIKIKDIKSAMMFQFSEKVHYIISKPQLLSSIDFINIRKDKIA